MAGAWKRLSLLSRLTSVVYGLTIAPLLIAIYPLCWIRVKITALVYCNKRRSLVSSNDIISIFEIEKLNSILNVIIVTRGNFSLDAMKELFLSKVLKATDANNRPLFPKFTRYIELCAGYLMWTEESNFIIDDHIRLYSGQPPQDEELLKLLITDLCNNPFPSLKSGWEIIVIPLEYSQSDVPQTCILFRVHHFITDGISIFRLIIEQMAGNHGTYQHILKRMQKKFKPKFNNAILNVLVDLTQITWNYVFKHDAISIGHDNDVFMKNKNKGCELSETGYIDWASSVKMDTIAAIRNATATTVNDVLMSCMAGAFRKYFLKHDLCPPNFLTTGIPISFHVPDDPVKTINKMYPMASSIPTGDMDCLLRLKATKVEMDHLKCSTDNISHRWFQQYFNDTIPYTWIKRMAGRTDINVAFSNMPGPTSKAAFDGNMIEYLVPMQLLPRCIGFTVYVFTYAGNVTVSVTVDKARVSCREDLRQLLADFVEEVQQLYNSVVGSPNKQPSTSMVKKMD